MADRIPFDSRLNLPPRRRRAWGRLAVVALGAALAAWWIG